MHSYHSLQVSSESQCLGLHAQLKITEFEKERLSMAHHETLTQLKHCQLDREKLQKKVRTLTTFALNVFLILPTANFYFFGY